MVLERVGSVISKFPLFVVILILVISGVMGFFSSQISFESDEDDFAPDSEIARANTEVMENYGTQVMYVQLIIEAKNKDVLTKEVLTEILEIEDNLTKDQLVNETLLKTAFSPTGMSSVADLILLLNDLYMGVEGVKMGLDEMADGIEESATGINQFYFFLANLVNDDNILAQANDILNTSQMFLQQPDQMVQPVDNRTSLQKIQTMSTESIKQMIYRTLNFNESEEGLPVIKKGENVETARQNFTDAFSNLQSIIQTISTYPNASVPVTPDNQSILDVLLKIQAALAFAPIPETTILTGTAFVLFDNIEMIGEAFIEFLTKDFDPDTQYYQELSAKGTMILVSMNASIYDEDPDLMLEAERKAIDIAKNRNHPSIEVRPIGGLSIMEDISTGAQREMAFLMLIALGLLLVILAVTYRSIIDMVISFAAIMMAIMWTIGSATILGWTFNTMMIAVPILIIGLGIDYGIHLTLRYKQEVQVNKKKINKAVTIAIASVGSALILATITTCFSFLSNLTSQMQIIQRFGVLSAIGVVASFIIMITFVPAAKQLVDNMKLKAGKELVKDEPKKNKKKDKKNGDKNPIVKFIGLGSFFAKKSPIAVIIVAFLITGISLFGAMELESRFEFEDFLPENSEMGNNYRYALKNFDLSLDYSYILIKGDSLTDGDVLLAMNETIHNMQDDEWVDTTDVNSILQLMQDMALDERSARPTDLYDQEFADMFYNSVLDGSLIPNKNITEIFTWLYESSLTHDSAISYLHVDEDEYENGNLVFDGLLIRIGGRSSDVERGDDIERELKADYKPLKKLMDDGNINYLIITGGLVSTKATMDAMNVSQYRSIALTVVASSIILTIMFFYEKRSFVLGVITTFPIVFVITWISGGMYLLGYNLNVLTITIGALTVGLGVTYAIHVTHRYIEELEKQRDVDKALDETLRHTGMALFGAAATTIGGFGVLYFSTLPPMQQFGTIAAMSILFSMISSIFVLPAFLRIWARLREDRGTLYPELPDEETEEPEE